MRISSRWLAGGAVVAVAAAVALVSGVQHSRERQRWAMFRTYCTECHNPIDLAGEISFEGLAPEAVTQHPELYEAAVRKLRGGLMPPPGSPRPPAADVDGMIA